MTYKMWIGEISPTFNDIEIIDISDEYVQIRVYVKKVIWNKFKLLVKGDNEDIKEIVTDLFETWITVRKRSRQNR